MPHTGGIGDVTRWYSTGFPWTSLLVSTGEKKSERESKHQNLGSAKLEVILVNYFQIAVENNCAVVIFTLKDKTKRRF